MMMAGTGLIFLVLDRLNPASRALSVCVIAIGLRVFFSGPEFGDQPVDPLSNILFSLLESTAIFAGVHWGLRIAQTGTLPAPRWTLWMFRIGQILIIIYAIMNLVFVVFWPEAASDRGGGLSRISGLQWAIFGPILSTAILCVGIGIAALRIIRIDAAEVVRLQALSMAGPFLLFALFLNETYVPITLTVGLLIFLWGSIRFLMIQGRRGQFMRRFLSPEVAQMVQIEGMERTLQRERRVLSVVSCDLRGFTAFSRQQPTDHVAELLESYYACVGDIASEYGGTIKDHAGDGVLILVGAPVHYDDHVRRALKIAVEIIPAVQQILVSYSDKLGVGAGVATGSLTIGAIQGAGRLEYVAIGNPVNLASRLCDRAEDGEVLSDLRTVENCRDLSGESDFACSFYVEERSPEPLKGFVDPIPVCRVSSDAIVPHGRRKRRRKGRRRFFSLS